MQNRLSSNACLRASLLKPVRPPSLGVWVGESRARSFAVVMVIESIAWHSLRKNHARRAARLRSRRAIWSRALNCLFLPGSAGTLDDALRRDRVHSFETRAG